MSEYDYEKTHGALDLESELFLDSLIVPLGNIHTSTTRHLTTGRVGERITQRITSMYREITKYNYHLSINFDRFSDILKNSLGFDDRAYTLDPKITYLRFFQQKSVRVDIAAWDLYRFMSTLKELRNWKHNYETRRAMTNKTEFDMKSVLEFTDADLIAAIHGNHHTFYWQQSYYIPSIVLGYEPKDRYEDIVSLPPLAEVNARLHKDILNKINTEYFLEKLRRIKMSVRSFSKTCPEYNYLIVSHDKRDNIGWNSLSGYTKIGNTSGLGQRRNNAISLNVKTFTNRIEVLEEQDFESYVKVEQLKKHNNIVMRKTIEALERARPVENEDDEYYRGRRSSDGKIHHNSIRALVADIEINIGKFEDLANRIEKHFTKIWGEVNLDIWSVEFWIRAERINHLLRSVRNEDEDIQRLIFGDNLQHYKHLNKAITNYVEYTNSYFPRNLIEINFKREEIEEGLKLLEMTDEEIDNSLIVSSDYLYTRDYYHEYRHIRELTKPIIAHPHEVYKEALRIVEDFNTKTTTLLEMKEAHQSFLKRMRCAVIKNQANLVGLNPIGLSEISSISTSQLENMSKYWRWVE